MLTAALTLVELFALCCIPRFLLVVFASHSKILLITINFSLTISPDTPSLVDVS